MVENEIVHAIKVNNWNVDSASQVNVILGDGSTTGTGNCGYHTAFVPSQSTNILNEIVYSVIPYFNTTGSCFLTNCPNRCDVDTALNTLSHETFEATTDPDGPIAWQDDSTFSLREIGDKCAYTWGSRQYGTTPNTANYSWGGRYYLLQMEWNDQFTVPNTGGWCTNYGPAYSGTAYTG